VLRLRPSFILGAMALVGCAGAPPPRPLPPPLPPEPPIASETIAPPPPAEHWYFEWLAHDGKRALLRRLDHDAKSTFHARIVDVDTGATIDEAALEELGKVRYATIGRKIADIVRFGAMIESAAFGEDLVRGTQIAGAFPFGSCGRFSAAAKGGAIAFYAGDFLYVADRKGHVRRRLGEEAAYDPRFTPDGKNLLFRRATGSMDRVVARYELFVVPADLSAPPRALPGTAGARDRFVVSADGSSAVAIASHEPQVRTCALAINLWPPFTVKKLACLDGAEPLVDSVLSPRGRWAAITTARKDGGGFRLRVLSLGNGKVVLDENIEPGLGVRAISDAGLLVQSGIRGIVVDDLVQKRRSLLDEDVDLGHRGFIRDKSELVYVRGGSVAILDLARSR
jgi:hypothetical protein